MKIGITGVTGHLGAQVVKDLIAQGISTGDIIGLARNVEKAKSNSNIEVRHADFDDIASLQKSLRGIDRLLLVSTMEPNPSKRVLQHTNVIKAAKENGVSLMVYTSGTKPEQNPLGLAHFKTEEFLKGSGVPYIILRNAYYLEAKMADIQSAVNNQPIVTNVGNGRFGVALRTEYAQAAANVLIDPPAINHTFNLIANVVDYQEFVSTLEKVLNKPVELVNVTDQEMEKGMLQHGMAAPVATLFAKANAAIRNGAGYEESDDFVRILHRPVKSLDVSIQTLLNK